MLKVLLLHNPGAGDEDHVKIDLVEAVEKEGFACVYHSTKKSGRWKSQLSQADFAVVVGGDGTVRAVVKELVKKTILAKKLPLALLPMGTANNLSKTLQIDRNLDLESHVKNWKKSRLQIFDVGLIKNSEITDFFLEGTGFGVFPHLMQKMGSVDKSQVESAQDKLRLALEVLHEIILSATAEIYRIHADGQIYEGKMLLLEVMNIQSIGPNIVLSPDAKTDDGLLDVVCVEEYQRTAFAHYIEKLIDQEQAEFEWKIIQARELVIDCESKYMHIDDELILSPKSPLVLEVRENLLEFLVLEN